MPKCKRVELIKIFLGTNYLEAHIANDHDSKSQRNFNNLPPPIT